MNPDNSRLMRCRRCSQMFEPVGLDTPVCPICQSMRDEQFIVVRELVREYPGITALEVHEATEVPMETILRFIDTGLLEVVKDTNRNGEISERVGLMIKRARERKELYRKPGKETKGIDGLKDDEKEKFTWHEVGKNG